MLIAPNGDVIGFELFDRLEDRTNFAIFRDAEWLGDSFLLAGGSTVELDGTSGFMISLVRVTEELDVTWVRPETGPVAMPVGVEVSSDGFILITRTSNNAQLVKTDFEGNFVSIRNDIFTQDNPNERGEVFDFIVDAAGDIVMVGEGTTVSYIGGFFPQIRTRPFVAKLTPGGDKIWETPIDARGTIIRGVTQLTNGAYATVGSAPGPNGESLINVILFDTNGNILN